MSLRTANQNLVAHVTAWWSTRAKQDQGASLVEYALLLALIAVICIGAVTFLGGSTSTALDKGAVGVAG